MAQRDSRPQAMLFRWLLPFLALAAACALYRYDPSAAGGWYPGCWFFALTGCHCPACGSTRALHALLHGRWLVALRDNLLLVAALPGLGYLLGRWWAFRADLVAQPPQRWGPVPVTCVCLALVAFAIARNLPWGPFPWLAP